MTDVAPATGADRGEWTVAALEECGFQWNTDIEAYVLAALDTADERLSVSTLVGSAIRTELGAIARMKLIWRHPK
ncbi:hypothetical protein [Streptomyces yanii]|uniref:Uncharacterized protein n=1 Tax=Streptomyces yanii TaxID=78510 RepID=A0ABV5RCJ5_9ACTN